jgi:hypothetical protein
MYVLGKSLLRKEWAARACGWDASALLGEILKATFPPSNASSFFARAKRSFRVAFAWAAFFGFGFRETIELPLRLRFDCGFFFGIDCSFLTAVSLSDLEVANAACSDAVSPNVRW